MSLDASFEKVEKVLPHPGADRLEIAIVSNYQVVCGKGEVKPGDVVFYIRDDAKLKEYDRVKEYDRKRAEIEEKFWKNKRDLDYNLNKLGEFKWRWKWQEPLVKYLGGGGRVKTIKLRGEYSSGIIVPVEKLFAHINLEESKDWKKDDEVLRGEYPGKLLSGKYGVEHWVMPIGNVGNINARGGLPAGIPKSDEENYQNRDERNMSYGHKLLITKKKDGASTTILCLPDGTYHVCSRSNDLKLDCDNVWNRCAKKVAPLGIEWAKHYGKRIALRGECCAPTLQKMQFNKDKDVSEPTFYLYGIIMPDETDDGLRNGAYGTQYHFLEVNRQIKELCGEEITTVPVLGEAVLTKELLEEYKSKPLDFGEGIVVNCPVTEKIIEEPLENGGTYSRKFSGVLHFKCKSLAYLEALSKKC